MIKVLILGAGRSSSSLIKYLLEKSTAEGWLIRLGDGEIKDAEEKIKDHPNGEAFAFDATDQELLQREISTSSLVISMLPASMHVAIARHCLTLNKHLITPSYISDEMQKMHESAKSKGVLFLNEMGVDPGIDHMSAMKIIDRIKSMGGELTSFESLTGGLVAPESDTNPWHYKITWNPRNVVLAGAGGTAQYIQNGTPKFIPYHRLFEQILNVEIDEYGKFQGYANRDSLKYLSIYSLENISTFFRGTLRKDGFCEAWQAIVRLGLTDDSFRIPESEQMTWKELTCSFLDLSLNNSPEQTAKIQLGLSDDVMSRLVWLGIFLDTKLGVQNATPAMALQKLIEDKWKLEKDDKDMIVMWHRLRYTLEGKNHEIKATLVVKGDDPVYTAMAKTVGLPIGIAANMILKNKLQLSGVALPTSAEIYNPVLEELENQGITFTEKHTVY